MLCNICQNEMENDKKFYKCSHCGFIMKKAIPNQIDEKNRYLKHVYDEGYVSYIKKLTSCIAFDDKEVLDFGCGQRPCLSNIYTNAKFTNYDLYFFPDEKYELKKYDIILMIEVIEHLKNPYEVVANLSKILNSNGKIYIHTMLYDKNTDFNSWWYQRDITHISFFSEETFKIMALKLNLKIEKIQSFIVLTK